MRNSFARPSFKLDDLRACKFFLINYGGNYQRTDVADMDYGEFHDTVSRLEKKLRQETEAKKAAMERASKRGKK